MTVPVWPTRMRTAPPPGTSHNARPWGPVVSSRVPSGLKSKEVAFGTVRIGAPLATFHRVTPDSPRLAVLRCAPASRSTRVGSRPAGVEQPPGRRVPQPRRAIVARGGHPAAVAAEARVVDIRQVSERLDELPPGVGVPDACRAVGARADVRVPSVVVLAQAHVGMSGRPPAQAEDASAAERETYGAGVSMPWRCASPR